MWGYLDQGSTGFNAGIHLGVANRPRLLDIGTMSLGTATLNNDCNNQVIFDPITYFSFRSPMA